MYSSSYRLEYLHFCDPALKQVPTAYLITMHDSPRRSAYMRQLELHRPTSHVVVVHNHGYADGAKPGIDDTIKDLWHANQFVSHLARHNDFSLILEDDVVFTPHLRDLAGTIDQFLASRRGTELVYALGIQPLFSYASDNHIRVLLGGAAQAVVYSAPALQYFPTMSLPRLPPLPIFGSTHIPHDILVFTAFPTYAPRRVCAFQPCDRTTNMRKWDRFGFMRMIHTLCSFDGLTVFDLFHAMAAFGGIGIFLVLLAMVVQQCLFRAHVKGGS